MRTLLIFFSLIATIMTVRAGDSNWPTGSADGGWPMGSAETGWSMNASEGAHVTAIANHQIRIGFSFDDVLRALGSPTRTSTTVTSGLIRDFWYYEVGDQLLLTVMFDNGIVVGFSN
jgi:hypothetical protein